MALTAKQQLFVKEYLIDLNAKQAAARAGYSEKTSEQIGYQLLQKPSVQGAIQVEMDARAGRTGITADNVLQELAAIGFAKIGDYLEYGVGGRVKFKPSSEVDTRVISEVTEKRGPQGVTVSFKMHNKVTALELMGRHLKLFTDKTEVTGEGGGPVKVDYTAVIRDETQRVLKTAPKTADEVNQQFPLPPPPVK